MTQKEWRGTTKRARTQHYCRTHEISGVTIGQYSICVLCGIANNDLQDSLDNAIKEFKSSEKAFDEYARLHNLIERAHEWVRKYCRFGVVGNYTDFVYFMERK